MMGWAIQACSASPPARGRLFARPVGGGGSILAVPLMVYLVGVPDAHVAIGTSAIAVGANAAANLVQHARAAR